MSTRFFASVRRNQKQWMVVVTVLAVVSFLFADSLVDRGRSPLSPWQGAFMIGILCGAGMCIVGYPRQKTTEFGISGFAVGFLAGFLGFSSLGINKPLVRTSAGNLTRKDFEQLHRQRSKINYFISTVARKAQTQPPYFGGVDNQSLVEFQIWQADARKMGIRISDERVNEFLKQLMQGRISKEDYIECLREVKIGEVELFDLLKQELSVQLARGLTNPPAYLPPIPQGFEQFIRQPIETLTYMQPTPYQLWSTFEKLTVKESLQAAAIPVRDFARITGEPSENELKAFYDRFKNRYWRDEAQPGFLEFPRVQLAYLTADFEKFEKGPDPTDQEVLDFYEANKEKYRSPMAKESTAPKLPDSVNDQPGADEPKKSEDKSPATGKDEKPPANAEKTPEQPEKPQNQEKSDDDRKSDSAQEPAEKAAESKPAEEKPASSETPAKDQAPDPKQSDEPKKDSSIPKLSSSPESLPAPKFRELNDELKLEIREEILRDRAFERIAAELDRAKEFMVNLGIDYDSTTDPAKKEEKAKSIAEQLKKYAEEHNLEYVETKQLTFEELSSETIGLAHEAKGRQSVVQDVFSPGSRNDSLISLYAPRRADLKSQRGSFTYWKIAEIPAHIADLKDEAVHLRVVSAWKYDQARSIAQKRATELLKKVKAEGNDLPAALSGESVTGDKNDPAITVIPTDPFTWLSTNRSVPGAPQDPQPTKIPLIDNVSESFMKTVFEEMNEGDVAVVPDDLVAVFYLVKVMNRETSQNDDGGVAQQERHQKFMKEEFASKFYPLIKTPYQALAQHAQQQINQLRFRNFEQSHQVDWDNQINVTPSRR